MRTSQWFPQVPVLAPLMVAPLILATAILLPVRAGRGADPPRAARSSAEEAASAGASIHNLLTQIIRAQVPKKYESTKDWGKKKSMTTGVRVRRDGLKIKVSRRLKPLNHGTWKRYQIRMIEPERNLDIRMENYRERNEQAEFDLVAEAKLHATGRLAQWERGVQLISLSAEADSRVRLRIRLQAGLRTDASGGKFPPDIVLDLRAVDAQLKLIDFRLRKVSALRGRLAHQLGKGVREILEEVIKRKQHKIVHKINKKIDKNRDKLRISVQGLFKSSLRSAAELFQRGAPVGRSKERRDAGPAGAARP